MRCLVLLSVVALAGCPQSTGKYPTLLPRPIESQSLAEPQRPAPVATPDAALDAKIAGIRGTLAKAVADFTRGAQDAEAKIAVARGLAPGTTPWLDAQVAMADLEVLRRPATTMLGDLEELAVARAEAGQPPYPALDGAIAEAEKTIADQQARKDALEKALGGTS